MTQTAFDILSLVYEMHIGTLTPYCMLEDGVYTWVCDYAGESFYVREPVEDLAGW